MRLPAPVDAAFVIRTELKLGAVKLTPRLKLPDWRVADTTTCPGLPTPRATRHATALSAAQAELIVEVPPIRPVALAPKTPTERPNTATDEAPDIATCNKLTDETATAS